MPSARRVDVHHHFYPPQYLEAMRQMPGRGSSGATFPGVAQWMPARTIEEMDKHRVQTAILSLSPPGPRMLDQAVNRKLARICGEYGAQLARDNPGRFGLFAPVPMPDVEGTLREIEYALDTLKADGIELMTSYGDKWLGHPDFDPVFEELNRRKALIYVHPLAAACSIDLIEWVPDALIEYPHDTSRAVLSLLFSGTLARLPDIRFIFCHAGGTVPFLSGRILHSGSNRAFLDRVPNGVDYELRKLHYDVALAAFEPSLAALFAYVPVSQVLLGSDYPFSSIGLSIKGLEEAGLPPETLDAIYGYGANAARLMPRLKD
jgi:predicted TIM-barrel fold metal-dependent hydrolase